MAELGLIASVVQVVDFGIRVSERLYTFGKSVASADDLIVMISKDISYTCSSLKTLGPLLERDRDQQLDSHNAINTAKIMVKEYLDIIHELEGALSKKITRMGLDGTSSRAAVANFERLKWPFLESKILLLWGNLVRLQSSLDFLLNVFVYAKLLDGRMDDHSVVKHQRSEIRDLRRATAESSRKFEALKAAMNRNGTYEMAPKSPNGCTPAISGLEKATISTEAFNKDKSKGKDKDLLEIPDLSPTTATLENHYLLIQKLLREVEAKEYNVGENMRRRTSGDDVLQTRKRDDQNSSANHGYTKLDEKRRDRTWILVDMTEKEIEEESSSGPESAWSGDIDSEDFDGSTSHSSQSCEVQMSRRKSEATPEIFWRITMDRATTSTPNFTVENHLDNREDPCIHLRSVSEASRVEVLRAAEETCCSSFQAVTGSDLHCQKTFPLHSSQLSTQNDRLNDLLLQSETSTLVTDNSSVVETLPTSQDLTALTDSSDAETFLSAKSVVSNLARDNDPLSPEDGKKGGPLVILGDQGLVHLD